MNLDKFLGIEVKKEKKKKICMNYIEKIMGKNPNKEKFISVADIEWEDRSFCYPYCVNCPKYYECHIAYKYECKIDYKKEAIKKCENKAFCPLKLLI